jgi:hypothetical protein
MNKRFILIIASWDTILAWSLYLMLEMLIPDYYLPSDPSYLRWMEAAIGWAFLVAAFPLLLVALFPTHEPPYFFLWATPLMFLGGIFWGLAVERIMHWIRRRSVLRRSPT